MDRRYTIPEIDQAFRPECTYALWIEILTRVALVQAEIGTIPKEAADAISSVSLPIIATGSVSSQQVEEIRQTEELTSHDVAAFLYWFERQIPHGLGRYLHYGLTSSDLVDTAMGVRFASTGPVYWSSATQMLDVIHTLKLRSYGTPALAHTHGQPAEPTDLGLIVDAWERSAARATKTLDADWLNMNVGKLSGPVGTYAHNDPRINQALVHLGLLQDGDGSQIVPRDRLANWATSAAHLVDRIAKIGLDFRLMASRGEVSEYPPSSSTVGSSSMPHKVNPVHAEQLAGLSRMANGYAQMLSSTQLWEQRDISHSCVERVAVPDLMHVTVHAMRALTDLLYNATWDRTAIQQTLSEALRSPHSGWAALRAVDAGLDRRAAREAARQWVAGRELPHHDAAPDYDWYVRNVDLSGRRDGWPDKANNTSSFDA